MIDLEKAKQAFAAYVRQYDITDEQIQLKIKHTYEVMHYSERIANDLALSDEQVKLASLIGLLHDIGRFEQIKRYHTFIDRDSVNHAMLGVEILKTHNFIRNFVEEGYDDIVLTAIANHNKFRIDENLSGDVLMQAKIIRDADKIDIFRVNSAHSCETLFMCSEDEMMDTKITEEVFDDFMKHTSILSEKRKTPGDILVSHVALVYDFNYPICFRIVLHHSWIYDLFHRFEFKDPETKRVMQLVEQETFDYLKNINL